MAEEALSLNDLRVESPGAATASAGKGRAATATATGADPNLQRRAETADASLAGPAREAAAASGMLSQAAADQAEATGYNARTGVVDPATMTAAGQMEQITGTDSPLMRQAAEKGNLLAAGRGMQDSSIGAGAAMKEMIGAATPLAQQDAQTYFSNMRANVEAQNRAREVSTGRETDISALNAQLGTDVSLQNALMANDMETFNAELATRVDLANAEAANRVNELNAQLETAVAEGNRDAANALRMQINDINSQVAQFNANAENVASLANADAQSRMSMLNAELETQVNLANAGAENRLNEAVMNANAELNRQFLAGEQAIDLADVQGRWQNVISSNQIAGSIWQSHLNNVASIMANPEIKPDRVASYINTMNRQLDGALGFIDGINSIQYDEAIPVEPEAPAATPTPSPTSPPGTPTRPPVDIPWFDMGDFTSQVGNNILAAF